LRFAAARRSAWRWRSRQHLGGNNRNRSSPPPRHITITEYGENGVAMFSGGENVTASNRRQADSAASANNVSDNSGGVGGVGVVRLRGVTGHERRLRRTSGQGHCLRRYTGAASPAAAYCAVYTCTFRLALRCQLQHIFPPAHSVMLRCGMHYAFALRIFRVAALLFCINVALPSTIFIALAPSYLKATRRRRTNGRTWAGPYHRVYWRLTGWLDMAGIFGSMPAGGGRKRRGCGAAAARCSHRKPRAARRRRRAARMFLRA